MADEPTPGTNPSPVTTPPPDPTPPAPPTPAPPVAPQNPADLGAILRTMADGLAALPEKLAQAVQEAKPVPTTRQPAQPNTGQPAGAQKPAQIATATKVDAPPTRRDRFGKWWFGA